MALMLHPSSPSSSSSFIKPHLLFHSSVLLKPTIFSIKSQQNSSTEETPSSKKPRTSSSPGLGFGSPATSAPVKKNQPKGKQDRARIIRREPAEKPNFTPTPEQAAQAEEVRKNESAFLLTWFGLGAVILLQGIALAASGFLPETWDSFLVKYLYPSFTPTVFLFVAGTVAYGVLKYLQNENSNTEN